MQGTGTANRVQIVDASRRRGVDRNADRGVQPHRRDADMRGAAIAQVSAEAETQLRAAAELMNRCWRQVREVTPYRARIEAHSFELGATRTNVRAAFIVRSRTNLTFSVNLIIPAYDRMRSHLSVAD